MAVGDQWMLDLLKGIVSDQTLGVLHEQFLHPHSPVQVFKRNAVASVQKALNMVYPFVQPAVDRLTDALSRQPDIVIVGVALVVFVLVLQVLNMIRRATMWAAGLAFRMLFYAAIVGLLAFIWQRGIETSIRDAMAIGSRVMSILIALKNVWLDEYHKYEAQAQRGGARAKAARGQARGR